MSISLQEWVRPIAYCEIDPYCQGVLVSRMQSGAISVAPIWDDITNLQPRRFFNSVDIIYGGFPCQDISVAGLGKGLAGERSGLFFEIVRLAKEIKPKFIFLENVPAITSRGGLQVVREITEMGYDCRWCVISAASIGACHRRERWFCLAKYTNSKHLNIGPQSEIQGKEQVAAASRNNSSASHSKGLHDRNPPSESMSGQEPQSRGGLKPYDVANPQHPGSSSLEERRSPEKAVHHHAKGENIPQQPQGGCPPSMLASEPISDTNNTSERGLSFRKESQKSSASKCDWWKTEPDVGRVADGVPHRVDRIKALGNAVVPQQAKEAFKILMGIK